MTTSLSQKELIGVSSICCLPCRPYRADDKVHGKGVERTVETRRTNGTIKLANWPSDVWWVWVSEEYKYQRSLAWKIRSIREDEESRVYLVRDVLIVLRLPITDLYMYTDSYSWEEDAFFEVRARLPKRFTTCHTKRRLRTEEQPGFTFRWQDLELYQIVWWNDGRCIGICRSWYNVIVPVTCYLSRNRRWRCTLKYSTTTGTDGSKKAITSW